MRRDLVLISEMIDAAEQARKLVVETSVGDPHSDRIRCDALLWNITVLGEAAGRSLRRSRTDSTTFRRSTTHHPPPPNKPSTAP